MDQSEAGKWYQWRITVNSDDEGKIRYEEPFGGTETEGHERAKILWARTSYIVPNNNYPSNKRHNRDVYVLLEVWSDSKKQYVKVWEHRGKLPVNAPAPRAA